MACRGRPIDASTRGAGRDRRPRRRLRQHLATHGLAVFLVHRLHHAHLEQPGERNPSSRAAVTYTVKLPPSGGQKMRVLVHDPGGVLAGARVPTAAEAADVANSPTGDEAALIEGRTGKMLVASWFGTSCDKKVDVTVVGKQVLIAPAPREACDSDALRRAVTLKFKSRVQVNDMKATLIQPPTQ